MLKTNIYARFAPIILLLAAIATPALFYGAKGAMSATNNDVRQWLPAGFVETQQYDWFLTQFGSEEMAVVSWSGATLDDPRVDRVTVGLQTYVGEEAVDSQSDSPKLFKRVTSTREALAEMTAPPMSLSRREALERLRGLLVGTDGKQAGLVVMVNDYGAKHRKAAVEAVQLVANREAGLSVEEVHIGGPTVDSVALDSESQRSRYLLSALSVSLALVLAWRCLKNVRLVVIVFTTAILAAMTSIAIVYYCGERMNLLLVMMPTLVYLTAMSGAVHLINYYRDALAEGHVADAPLQAVKAAFVPGSLCALTTAVGLGSLATSQVVPVRQFGMYSALGVMAALPILYLLLPSLLQRFPLRVSREAEQRRQAAEAEAPAWTTHLANWLARHHALVIASGVLMMIATGLGVLQLNTSVKLLNLFSPQSKIIRDYAWLETNMGPLVPIEVVLKFDPQSELSLVDRLAVVKRVQREMASIEKVGATMSAATFAPDLPQDSGTRSIAKRVLLTKKLNKSRDYLEGTHYMRSSKDGELWRVSARVEALNSLDYGYFIEKIKERVEPVLQELGGNDAQQIEATYTGIVPLVYKAQRTLLNDLMSSFLCAFLIIGAMMILLLRNFTAGLVSMIPNIFPAVMIFGAMGLSGMLCDIGSMMTAGVALGIAVDDTIHFLTWFRRGLSQGLSRHDAIILAYERCATAMIQSSIICGLGLLVFSFSKFLPTSRFAWLMATMLGAALAGDLFLLPALLASPLGRFFEPKKKALRATPVEVIVHQPAELTPAS